MGEHEKSPSIRSTRDERASYRKPEISTISARELLECVGPALAIYGTPDGGGVIAP